MYSRIERVEDICKKELDRELNRDELVVLGLAYTMGLNHTEIPIENKSFVINAYHQDNSTSKNLKENYSYFCRITKYDERVVPVFSRKDEALNFTSTDTEEYNNSINFLLRRGFVITLENVW